MFHSCRFATLSLLLTKLTLNAPRKQDEENAICGKKEYAAVILLGFLCLITSNIQLLCKILSAEHFQYLLLLFVKCFILLFFKLKDPHLRFSNFLFLIIFVIDCLFMVRGLVHGLKLWVLGV